MMEQDLKEKVLSWAKRKSIPVEGEVEAQVRKLLSPYPFGSLSELTQILKPRPPYVGPGIWLRAIGRSPKGEGHA